MTRVRIVLVNYRSLADVDRRVQSAALHGHDVIVVDNASNPEAVERLCAATGARALLLPTNAGFAAGVNAAVRSTPVHDLPWLLLNPDVELTPDVLDALQEALVPGVDGVSPLLQEPSGRLQVGVGGGPLTARAVASYFLFVSHITGSAGVFFTRRQSQRRHRAAWLCMACLLLQPDVFDRFGPIPDDEIVYAEDLAWGSAASARGASWRLLNTVTVAHAKGSSGSGAAWIGAIERLCRRRMSRASAAVAIGSIRVGLGVRRAMGRDVT